MDSLRREHERIEATLRSLPPTENLRVDILVTTQPHHHETKKQLPTQTRFVSLFQLLGSFDVETSSYLSSTCITVAKMCQLYKHTPRWLCTCSPRPKSRRLLALLIPRSGCPRGCASLRLLCEPHLSFSRSSEVPPPISVPNVRLMVSRGCTQVASRQLAAYCHTSSSIVIPAPHMPTLSPSLERMMISSYETDPLPTHPSLTTVILYLKISVYSME